MPTDSLFEQAALNIVSTLAAMDSATYGFAPLVRRRGVFPTSKNVDASVPGTTYEVDIEVQQNRIEHIKQEGFGASYYVLHFSLICFVSQSDTSETSIDTLYNQIYSEITQAMMADATRGGVAYDTDVMDAEDQISFDGQFAALKIDAAVYVQSAMFNPQTT